MRLLTLLLLLLAAPSWAQWSSTVDKPCTGWIGAYESAATVELNATTYELYTGWDVNLGYSKGGSYITTGSNAITIGSLCEGQYKVAGSMAFQGSVGEYHCDVFVSDVEIHGIGFRRSIGNTNQFGVSAFGPGAIMLPSGAVVTIKCKAEANETLQADTASLYVERVGPYVAP